MKAGTALLVALLLATNALAEGPPGQVDLGERALRHGDHEYALACFKKARAANPGDLYAHLGLQCAARLAGSDVSLREEYERLYSGAPRDPVKAGACAALLGPERAIEVLATVKKPNFHVHLLRSRALRALDDEQATAELLAALAKCPEDARAQEMLAREFLAVGQPVRSLSLFRKAWASNPQRVSAAVGLADALRLSGEADEALKILVEATALDAEDPEIPFRMGLVHLDRDEPKEALSRFSTALSHNLKDVDALLGTVMALLLAGEPKEAEGRARKAIDIAPRRLDARHLLAYCLEIQDRNNEALQVYEEAVKLSPLDSASLIGAGWVLLKKGRNEDAVTQFRRAADADPGNATALFMVGFASDLRGEWSQAIKAYEQLLADHPDFARAWNNLGLDHDLLGKSRKALDCFKKALALMPESVEYALNLGNAWYNARKFKEGIVVFGDLADQRPDSVHAFTGLGRCLNAARRYEDAAKAYEQAIELSPEEEAADLHLIVGVLYQERIRDYAKALAHYEAYISVGGDDPVVAKWMKDCRKRIR